MKITIWGETWGRDLELTTEEWQQMRGLLGLSLDESTAGVTIHFKI